MPRVYCNPLLKVETAVKLGSQEDPLGQHMWLLRKTCPLVALHALLLPMKCSSECTAVCRLQSHRSLKHACT